MFFRKIISVVGISLLSACVSGGQDDVLQSAVKPSADAPVLAYSSGLNNKAERTGTIANQSSFATDQRTISSIAHPEKSKTYLINGLASSSKFIGYGFTNLSKKIPGSKLHNYASFIESSTVIRARVTRELKAAYAADPNVRINLIGISFGANIVTLIASDLERKDIPVNYMATLEGPAMVPIKDNVKTVDSFSCTRVGCFRTKSRLASRNKDTKYSSFKIKSGHIALANHPEVHARVLSQL